MLCRNCQDKGHLERTCDQMPSTRPIKRRNSNDDEESATNSKKIAVVKQGADDSTEESVSVSPSV